MAQKLLSAASDLALYIALLFLFIVVPWNIRALVRCAACRKARRACEDVCSHGQQA